jgi:hypothetical protein
VSCYEGVRAHADGLTGLSNRIQPCATQCAATTQLFGLSQLHGQSSAAAAGQFAAGAGTLSGWRQFVRDLSQRTSCFWGRFGFQELPALPYGIKFSDWHVNSVGFDID